MIGTALGTCFGFSVHTALPLEYLRAGEGEPLEVTAPAPEGDEDDDRLLIEWKPSPGRPLEARLYADEQARFRLWIQGGGWFSIDPHARRVHVPEAGVRTEERLWGIPALLCFRARGDLPLHAAAVEVGGRALILAAPRTYGKTTLAAAFHRAGHRVLSEDLTCIRLEPQPHVVPGPAMLRLRRDVAAALDLPDADVVGEDDDRIHYALRDRGNCEPVPLREILLLHDSDDDATLEPAELPDALRDLWALSFRLPTEADVGRSFAAIADLAGRVPVRRLLRPLRLDDLGRDVERLTTVG